MAPVHLDIRRITLDGYSPGQRDGFTASLRALLAERGAPAAAARQAAEVILAAVDARLAGLSSPGAPRMPGDTHQDPLARASRDVPGA